MAEDLDVEAMLEAPYRKDGRILSLPWAPKGLDIALQDEQSGKSKENGDSTNHKSSGKSSRNNRHNRSRSRHRSRSKHRSRSRNRSRSKSKDRKDGGGGGGRDRRDRDKGGDRDRGDRDRGDRDRDRDKGDRDRGGLDRRGGPPGDLDKRRNNPKDPKRSRSKDRRSRSKDKKDNRRRTSRDRRRSPSPPSVKLPFPRRTRSPIGLGYNRSSPLEELSPEERDQRTVFCMQLSQKIRARDLEEFFSSVGKVRDVRLITCNKTRRFKGIAYIEFRDPESVPLALGLSGQKLLGIPIIVQHTQAEKNRMGNSMPNLMPKGMTGPMRLYVGSLHFNITEEMLRGIFEPFGKIDHIQLIMDPETGRSKGYGFVTFHNCEDAKKALEQLNGFELAGRPMKVGNVTERLDLQQQGPSLLDTDELDRSGIDLGATGRLQLMFKLAEGAGMAVPPAAANALSLATGQQVVPQQTSTPPIATQCFMLSNMFDPTSESNPTWDIEIRDDVIEECNKHGGVLHVYVDKASPQGNVYVKCPSIATAVASVNSLHGRWFAGRVITAAYVPLLNYHSLFPDAMAALQLLLPSQNRRGM